METKFLENCTYTRDIYLSFVKLIVQISAYKNSKSNKNLAEFLVSCFLFLMYSTPNTVYCCPTSHTDYFPQGSSKFSELRKG